MNQQSKYVVREAIDYGCRVYNVVNIETGNRINYFADYESAKEFAERQNNLGLIRKPEGYNNTHDYEKART